MTIDEFVVALQEKFPAEKDWDAVFKVLEGKRYWKIVRHDKCKDLNDGCSVYAFIDKNNAQKSFAEICEFLEEKYDLNWDRDNIFLIDPPEVIDFH